MTLDTLDTTHGHTPLWSPGEGPPSFAPLSEAASTDVVIVGAGITGLTAAYLLATAGRSVVVLERARCAAADTGHTSAHLTMVTDVRLTELTERLGRSHAQAVWDAGLSAIFQIADIVDTCEIDAAFEWVPGYQHAPADAKGPEVRTAFQRDAELARDLGFDVEYVDDVPLVHKPGMRIGSQARLHPIKYAAGLARAIVARGGRIHEHSEASSFTREPRSVEANGCTVTCQDVIVATHNPLVGLAHVMSASLFQTKLALYSSYVVAGRVPSGTIPDALWWDTADPYQYLRIEPQQGHDTVILGGGDHKTGQADDTRDPYRRLEQRLQQLVPGVEVTHRWSGQVIETPDGLPYIGRSTDHQYSATGYAGNGLTFGTLAGAMIAEGILGRSSPWTDLFDPGRKALGRALYDYVKENLDYPYYMIRDRFRSQTAHTLHSLRRGQGCIVESDGRMVAAYRDAEARVTLRSAVCTHMGCQVVWNTAERTWDCPCHGSRFSPSGDVIAGPAEEPLQDAS
jgi:glycine/D-amino acid oxidase-like deaminating enzyme/nitrite reductase/ring-hydroxylating ferredoxin subunit